MPVKMTETTISLLAARELLGMSQVQLATELDWSSAKQVSNIETGVRPLQRQTALAVECLLRRSGKWREYMNLK